MGGRRARRPGRLLEGLGTSVAGIEVADAPCPGCGGEGGHDWDPKDPEPCLACGGRGRVSPEDLDPGDDGDDEEFWADLFPVFHDH